MNVLVVDDQERVLKATKLLVHWNQIGVDRVFTASSAEMARQVFARETVDILLTDIEMPGEDGLALHRWQMEHSPDTACIFLTAFTLPGLALMGFGGHAIAVSADQKVSDTGELQERLAANAAEQQAANDQAAAEAAEQKAAEDEAAVDLSGVACIGDSVMLGSSGELRKVLPGCIIDAEVSRYVGGGLDAAKEMAAQGRLGKNVVIALGTNGPIAGYEKYEVQTRALLEYLGPDRHIFWVNVYCPELSWQQTNNDYLVSMAKDHPNVTIVDWYGLVSKHPEWLGGDGIHPNDEGTAAYAKLIHDTMAETLAHPAAD